MSRPLAISLVVVSVALFVALGLSLSLPVWLGPDEGPHWQYAGFLAREHRLPDAELEDVFQSQHPPAYHAVLGLVRPMLSDLAASCPTAWRNPGAVPLPAHIDLESNKVVPDPASLPSLAPSVLMKTDLSKIPGVSGFEVHVWRLIGVVFLLLTILVMCTTESSLASNDRMTATFAVATAVLTPSFLAAFATPGNDQWAALFGTLGFSLVVCGKERHSKSVIASVVLALGVLGKLTVLGPAIAAATWAAFDFRTTRERIIAFARVAGLPLVVGLAWVLRQAIESGGAHGAATMGQLHSSVFRDVAPDALGLADVVGRWLFSFVGEAGADGVTPGTLVIALGVMVPITCVIGSFWILLRGPSGPARRASASFLAGVLFLGVALAIGNRQYFWIHGRYFIALVLPATLAFAEVMKTFLGARARTATLGTAILMACASLLLLFGNVIPTYHPPRSKVSAPGLVAYVDAGSYLHRDATTRGTSRRKPGSGYATPADTAAVDPVEASIRIPGLPQGVMLMAHVTLWAPPRPDTCIVDLVIDGEPVTGALSPELCPDGIDVVVPMFASADGEIVVTARTKLGAGAGIAEVAVLELGIAPPETRREGNDLIVTWTPRGNGPRPRLHVQPIGVAESTSAAVLITTSPLSVVLAGCGSSEGLSITPVSWTSCHFKVARFATADAEIRGDVRALGFDVVRVPPGTPKGTVIAPLFGSLFPKGSPTLRVLDATGQPLPSGIVELLKPDGQRADLDHATVLIDEASQAGRCGDLVSIEPSRIGIDRILVNGSHRWSFPIPR